MRHRLVFVLALLTLAVAVVAQEKAPATEQPAPDPQMQAMIAAMERFGTPGPEHKILLEGVGTWDVEARSWMDPAAPPITSKGTSVQRAILGGRYVQYDFEGEMMGSPFGGFGLSGYDRYNKKYVSLWLDTWGTGFYLTEGTCDAEGKVCTETGTWDDYTTGTKMKVKEVYTHISKDKFTMEMFVIQPDGKELRTMELTYTRRK